MRRLLLLSLVSLIGCQGLVGPWKRAAVPPKVDPPYLPIPEQEARGRENLAYPDALDNGAGPRTYAEVPSQQYGRLSH